MRGDIPRVREYLQEHAIAVVWKASGGWTYRKTC